MHKSEDQGETECGCECGGVCDAPCEAGEEHEEGEEVGEGGIRAVPGVFCFCERGLGGVGSGGRKRT